MEEMVYQGAVKYLAEEEKPREKVLKHGFGSVTTAELLAILLSSGSPGESVIDLCKRIMRDNDNQLHNLARRSVKELANTYRGVGTVKAVTLLAALELARRCESEEYREPPKIQTPEDAYRYLRPLMCDLNNEEVYVLLLDRAKHLLRSVRLSQGGSSASVVEVKAVLRTALENSADSIILAHNHPSGNLLPSVQDDHITRSVNDGCRAIGIPLIDHLIVSRAGYYSYSEEGKI